MRLEKAEFMPGREHWHAYGKVYGSDRFVDGTYIVTSGITKIINDGGVQKLVTKNHIYDLVNVTDEEDYKRMEAELNE